MTPNKFLYYLPLAETLYGLEWDADSVGLFCPRKCRRKSKLETFFKYFETVSDAVLWPNLDQCPSVLNEKYGSIKLFSNKLQIYYVSC